MDVPDTFTTYVLSREFVTVEQAINDLGLKRITVMNYLSRMKREGSIDRVGRGKYRVLDRERGAIDVPKGLKDILNLINESYPDVVPVVWAASMVSDYMHNLPGGDLFSIDIPKEVSTYLRAFLGDRGHLVFVDPSPIVIEDYAWSDLEPIFMFKRGETYASRPEDGYRIASLERIWIDMYYLRTRKDLPFPLAELGVVLRNLVSDSSISFERLLRYSSRRGLRHEVIIILYEIGKEDPHLRVFESILPRGLNAYEWVQEVVAGSVEGW